MRPGTSQNTVLSHVKSVTYAVAMALSSGLIAAPFNAPQASAPQPVGPSSQCLAGLSKILQTRPEVKKGQLFSAIRLPKIHWLTLWWGDFRKELVDRYPELSFVDPRDMNITIVYIGSNWDASKLPELTELSLPQFTNKVQLNMRPKQMGKNSQILALELSLDRESEFADAVHAAQAELVARGLKPEDVFDGNFRARIVLGKTREKTPDSLATQQIQEAILDIQEMARFPGEGPGDKQKHIEDVQLELGPHSPVKFYLSGATRPKNAPDYLSLDEFVNNILNP